MSARERIAIAVHVVWCLEPNHEDCDGVDERDAHMADAVIAAVRSMPVEDQAELISGEVRENSDDTAERVVGPWREVPR